MNQLLLWGTILLLWLSSFTSNMKLPQTTAPVAISNDAFNIFYIGMENPITVALPNIPIEQTKVTISNGTLRKTNETGKYIVTVFQEGETTIQLEGKTPNGRKITSNHVFDVQKFPTPLLGIKGQKGWKIPILDLWSSSGLYSVNSSLMEVEPIDLFINKGKEYFKNICN